MAKECGDQKKKLPKKRTVSFFLFFKELQPKKKAFCVLKY